MKHLPINPESATARAYAEMLEEATAPRGPIAHGRRLVRPDDPDQGIRISSGDTNIAAHFSGANRMLLRGPYNWNSKGEAVRDEILENVSLGNCRKTGQGRALWGINSYEVKSIFQYACLTDRMGTFPEPTDGSRVEGHGDYLHGIEGFRALWERCRFEYLMGNAIQCVRRVGESAIEPNPDYAAPQQVSLIRQGEIIDACQGEERGSFAVAWYAPGSLRIDDLTVYWTRSARRVRGALLVGDPKTYIKANRNDQRTHRVEIDKLVIVDNSSAQTTHDDVQVQGCDTFQAQTIVAVGGQGRPFSFIYDEDCASIDATLYGRWVVKRRIRKDPRVAPEQSGFRYEIESSREGVTRVQYQMGA